MSFSVLWCVLWALYWLGLYMSLGLLLCAWLLLHRLTSLYPPACYSITPNWYLLALTRCYGMLCTYSLYNFLHTKITHSVGWLFWSILFFYFRFLFRNYSGVCLHGIYSRDAKTIYPHIRLFASWISKNGLLTGVVRGIKCRHLSKFNLKRRKCRHFQFFFYCIFMAFSMLVITHLCSVLWFIFSLVNYLSTI
jgi:hypothetical protein